MKKELGKDKILDKNDPEKMSRTLFVGNVPIETKEKELKRLFTPYGRVESLRFRSISFDTHLNKKVAFIQKKFSSERKNMNAYVVMDSEKSAQAALVLNNTVCDF